VPCHSAVRIDNDLASGQPRVAHRPADHEPAGGIDQKPDTLGVQVELRQLRQHHMLTDVHGQQLFQVDSLGVLGRQHHGVQPNRLVARVFDRHLGLAVRPQVRHNPVLADAGQAAGKPVRQCDRQRHQLRGVRAGVAEHQTLVAGALPVDLVVSQRLLDAGLVGMVHALCDVRRLRTDRDVHPARVTAETFDRRVVADVQDLLPHDPGDVDVCLGGHLTGHVHLAGGDQRFHRDPARRVLGQQRVEDGIADRVADLVGMPLGHRL
jgi:hypothetical protein